MANENELKKVVLLIEDEIDLVDLYTEILNEAGYDVLPSYDGDDGIYKAKNDNWDLMLLDIMLPEKDGMAVLEEVKKTEKGKQGPIVLLTNLNSEDLIERAYKLGADDYLIKSEISLDDIVAKVKQYLQ
ncbi:response regulator transcription factor [Patescibacteria group bacterium]